ncbi:hypothetical protein BDV93DRAFT_514176 [Ceratobasidium sp. AG-I]|nr:hypothetical protein BDV93DRAFT_514176 [Ceratobasidium sp. AG-I]
MVATVGMTSYTKYSPTFIPWQLPSHLDRLDIRSMENYDIGCESAELVTGATHQTSNGLFTYTVQSLYDQTSRARMPTANYNGSTLESCTVDTATVTASFLTFEATVEIQQKALTAVRRRWLSMQADYLNYQGDTAMENYLRIFYSAILSDLGIASQSNLENSYNPANGCMGGDRLTLHGILVIFTGSPGFFCKEDLKSSCNAVQDREKNLPYGNNSAEQP